MTGMQSDSIAALAAALAKAQSELTAASKNREVTVKTRSGSDYKFKYATFDGIIEHVRAPLTKNGLWFVQALWFAPGEPQTAILRTILTHSSGEWIASELPVPDQGTNQEFGSSLTYRKRYALASLLGVGSEDDDDANVADGNSVQSHTDKQQAAKAPPKPAEVGRANQDDKAREKAVAFGQKALTAILGFGTKKDLDAWENDPIVKASIPRIKQYDERLHTQIIDALKQADERLGCR